MQVYTKYHHCSLYSSWEMNLNIKFEVRVETNVDGLTNGQRTDRQKTRSLYHAMLKAGTTMTTYGNFSI